MRANVFAKGQACAFLAVTHRFEFLIESPEPSFVVGAESCELLGHKVVQLFLNRLKLLMKAVSLLALHSAATFALPPARDVVGAGIGHTLPTAGMFGPDHAKGGGRSAIYAIRGLYISQFLHF